MTHASLSVVLIARKRQSHIAHVPLTRSLLSACAAPCLACAVCIRRCSSDRSQRRCAARTLSQRNVCVSKCVYMCINNGFHTRTKALHTVDRCWCRPRAPTPPPHAPAPHGSSRSATPHQLPSRPHSTPIRSPPLLSTRETSMRGPRYIAYSHRRRVPPRPPSTAVGGGPTPARASHAPHKGRTATAPRPEH